MHGRWHKGPDAHFSPLGFTRIPELGGVYVWYRAEVTVLIRGTLSCCPRRSSSDPGSGSSFNAGYEISGRAATLIPVLARSDALPSELPWPVQAPQLVQGIRRAIEQNANYQRVMRTIRTSPSLACQGALTIPEEDLDFGTIYLNEDGTKWSPPAVFA